jgi:hypothetical protein
MNLQLLTDFFMWCTIINGCLLLLWTGLLLAAPELIYRTKKRWFPGSKETLLMAIYCFLGLFKMLYIMFNVVPFIALLIIG